MSFSLRTPADIVVAEKLLADLQDLEAGLNKGIIDQVQFKAQLQPNTARLEAGYTYYDSALKVLRTWDGSKWMDIIGVSSPGGGVPGTIDLSSYLYLPGRIGGQVIQGLTANIPNYQLKFKYSGSGTARTITFTNQSDVEWAAVSYDGKFVSRGFTATGFGPAGGGSGTVSIANVSGSTAQVDMGIEVTGDPLPGCLRFKGSGISEFIFTTSSITTVGDLPIAAGSLWLGDSSTSRQIKIFAPSPITSNYSLLLPPVQGGANTFLKNDGSGNLTWVAAGSAGIGTVTSIGLSLPAEFNVSGSPVTTSGTLTGTWANQTTNKVLAAPNGSTGVPTFRVLVAADIPNLSSLYAPVSVVNLLPLNNTWTGTNLWTNDTSYTKGLQCNMDVDQIGLFINTTTSASNDVIYISNPDYAVDWIFKVNVTGDTFANSFIISPIAANHTIQIVNLTNPTADRIYSIDPTINNTNFAMCAGTQSISGAKTFSSACIFTAGTRLNVNGSNSFCYFGDRVDTTKQAALDCSGITAGNTRSLKIQDRSGTLVVKPASSDLNLTGQTANIASTNLLTTPGAGMYQVIAYLEGTTVGTGTLTLTIGWTDDVGATTDAGLTFLLTGTGRASRVIPIYVASGSVTYQVSGYLTGTFALRIRTEALE